MTPDMKRLCDAAYLAGLNGAQPSPEHKAAAGPVVEAVVRAVLMALREPSDDMIDAVPAWDYPAEGWFVQPWEMMIDHILAEPAKA